MGDFRVPTSRSWELQVRPRGVMTPAPAADHAQHQVAKFSPSPPGGVIVSFPIGAACS